MDLLKVEYVIPIENKLKQRLIYLIMIDITCTREELAVQKKLLISLIKTLPADIYVSLITISNRIGVYDFNGNLPRVIVILIYI